MNSQHSLSKMPSDDLIAKLKTQQANILQKIDAFKQAAVAKTLQRYVIRQLQQKYNDLVDQRARLESSPLSDPIEKLPPELWPDIIEPLLDVDYPVDVLLELTSVSRTWSNALISLPRLWTHIVLDDTKHDYLAKAVMGLYLSGSCEINVFVCLSMASWPSVLSFITAENKRIHLLSLNMPNQSNVEEVIAQLGDMPVLEELYLPGQNYRRLWDIHLDALGLKQMPSLQVLKGPYIAIESELGRHLITSHTILYNDLAQRNVLERYGKLPNLRGLTVFQPSPHLDPSFGTLNVSLSYIKNFTCHGVSFNCFLNCVGTDLTKLSIGVEGFASLEELASSLRPFQCLHWLEIFIADPSFTYNGGTITTNLPSIRSLGLSFEGYGREADVGNWMIEESVDSLYEGFISVASSVEVLELRSGMLTGAGMKYIAGLTNLLQLGITESLFIPTNYPVSISSKSLQTLTVNELTRAPELLVGIVTPALRNLRIGGSFIQSASDSEVLRQFEGKIGSPSFIISGETITDITSLTIMTDKHVRWEFYSLSTLKELEITENRDSVMLWASDALEAILMRPCDLPVLEKIKLTGQFFEWDILLLMLERRILYSHLGISQINTLVLPPHLSYKLLHPITALLQGKLPEREENDQFSLTAAEKRVWDNNISGCYSCCYAFRICDALTLAGADQLDIHPYDITMLALGYELPSEYLTAYPPLSPEIAEWLSGKLVRRREFVRNAENAVGKCGRVLYCDLWPNNRAPVAITGHSLDGAYFETT